jgi:hypothetical protein
MLRNYQALCFLRFIPPIVDYSAYVSYNVIDYLSIVSLEKDGGYHGP